MTHRPARDFEGEPLPRPVVWRDTGVDDDGTRRDSVLCEGEVALLSGADGIGKSTVTLALAAAAAAVAEPADATSVHAGAACGLRVAPGPVMLVSYEDSPERIVHRLGWYLRDGEALSRIYILPAPMPLWGPASVKSSGPSFGDGPCWEDLWDAVHDVRARLVVIDPASAALVDANVSQTAPVRGFLRALTFEAKAANCGVLVVTNDTKSGRRLAAAGQDPGADAVAGSSAWYDGARGVLTLARDPQPGSKDSLMRCIKSNYGPIGWGSRLTEWWVAPGEWRGLTLRECLTREGLEKAEKAAAKKREDQEADRKAAVADRAKERKGRRGARDRDRPIRPGEIVR